MLSEFVNFYGNYCFNRYMVECESAILIVTILNHRGFNRYMVECELKKHLNPLKAGAVLIDTWWNVNMYDLSNAYFTNPF